jgi:hypothetical protein
MKRCKLTLLAAVLLFPGLNQWSHAQNETNRAKSPSHTKIAESNQTAVAHPAPTSTQTPVAAESQRNPTPNTQTTTSRQQTSDEDRAAQQKLTWFTGVLAGVGFLQLVVMFLTWLVYQRQAHEMRRQRHEMRRQRHEMWRQRIVMRDQLETMRNQLGQMEGSGRQTDKIIEHASDQVDALRQAAGAMQDTAEAGKMGAAASWKVAEAARLNAQAVINSERPWVSIVAAHSNGVYTFGAVNFGRTPAEIISYSTRTFFAHTSSLIGAPKYGLDIVPPLTFLVPGSEPGDQMNLLTYDVVNIMKNDPARAAELNARTQAIIFLFRILYRNTLSNVDSSVPPYETRICFYWTPGLHPKIGGPAEYNQHI